MANICSLALVVYAVCFSVLIPQATSQPFLFPETQSTIVPDPSTFFAPNLLSSPLPTNSFFQNFVLNNGDQPEYIHPYTMKSSNSSLSLAYPSFSYTSTVISTTPFQPDLTISGSKTITIPDPNNDHHVVSDFDDLSVTLDFPSSNLRFFLIRGSPYLTCFVSQPTPVSISTSHTIVSSSSASGSNTKFIIKLDNGQTWLIYTSSPTDLTASGASSLTFNNFSGNIRVAVMPDAADPKSEAILDQFSSSYPTSGAAVLENSNTLTYKWEKTGGDLLILAHPLHLMLLSNATVLQDFKYKSIDGNLVGIVGDTWVLNSKPIPVTWNSIGGVKIDLFPEIISALRRDVDALSSTELSAASYFYGKLVAKAARLALIAEEVACPDVIPAIRTFLAEKIQPWLDGTFSGNGFLYDKKWGGLVTKQGSTDKGADFGFGLYSDHHYHLGYFVYGISVLAKIDPAWGEKYKPQAYSLLADYLNKDKQSNPNYTRLRCFDLYKLHSWAGGVTEFADGRNQESTSEAVNAYYAAALMGKAYNDPQVEATGSLLTTLEIQAAQMWWHLREGGENQTYEQDFAKENRVVGVLWSTKRDSGLWFAAAEAKEIRLGIQVIPISPITEVLFSDTGFPSELVNWALPALGRTGVTEAWKGFVYALQGLYDKAGALEKIKSLTGFDDGNSLSNLLWWIHSRS